MLQSMRHMSQSWVFKALMILLVVSFGIWGIGDIFRGNPMQRAVATVGSQSITVQMLDIQFRQALARLRGNLGPDLTEKKAKDMGLMDKALDGIIDRTTIDLEIKRLGIDVTNKAVLDWTVRQPQLLKKDGSFDKDLYHKMLENHHEDEATYLEKQKEALAEFQLMYAIGNSGTIPAAMAEPVAKARGQKRILDVITIADSSMHDIPAPDDKALHDFYQKNPQLFTAPEYRGLTIAELSAEDVAKDIGVSDEDVKKEYDSRVAQFAHPERRDILQVVVQDEAKAKQLAEAARASGNLPVAAEGMGLKTVPLNKTEEKTLLPALAKPVFALKPNEVSEPVQSALGWHVVQLKKIFPAGTSSFDEVKDDLRDSMKRDRAADELAHTANQLDDELAAGHSLDDIANTLKLRVTKLPAVDAEGKAPDGKVLMIPDKPEILKAAFSQGATETSPLIDDHKGGYIVVRTEEVTPSAVQPFDKVKDKAIAAWKSDQQAKKATAEAEKIAKALREGKPSSAYAGQNGIEVRNSKPISLMGDSDPGLPAMALPQILKMKKGEVITSSSPDKQFVLRLAQFVDADAGPKSSARGMVTTKLIDQIPDELTDEYLRYLRQIYPSHINRDTLDTLRAQGENG